VLRYSVFSINEIFLELKEVYTKILEKKERMNVSLSFELPRGDIKLYSDPFRIKQVLSNLLTNATSVSLKY
jgi:signal transduction histidine kinase